LHVPGVFARDFLTFWRDEAVLAFASALAAVLALDLRQDIGMGCKYWQTSLWLPLLPS
jgi:hypothetical protein